MADKFERISNFATRSRHDITLAVTTDIIEAKCRDAKQNSRKREILALQRGNEDSLQRMINAIEPGSYVQPHRHHAPPKAESVVLLAGSIGFVPFHEDGTPDYDSCILLDRTRGTVALDCRESIWHTFFALEPNTVVFESKSGPFDPHTDKEFAPWAPAEGSPEAAAYLDNLVAGFKKNLPPMG
jgi:cupin fold WbuC family metalloprotein